MHTYKEFNEEAKTKIKSVVMANKCYNCNHASDSFKVNGVTHHHCFKPENEELAKQGELSAWDTLTEWHSSCDDHQLKTK